jgi:APA family basic amino acid/polyamine antiporter
MSNPQPPADGAPAGQRQFLRVLGPVQGVAIVVGTVIGSGIFAVPQKIAADLGGYGLASIMAVWLFCGFLSLAGALAYAELGAMMPRAGGQYVFLSAAYGPRWGFLYGWMEFWVARPGSVAAIAVIFARYFDRLSHFSGWLRHDLSPGAGGALAAWLGSSPEPVIAVAVIVALSVVNVLGIRWGGAVQVVFTGLKVAALLGIVALGFLSPARDLANWSWPARSPDPAFFSLFGLAMVEALWAYDGWTNATTVAEEMRDPERNVPRSLIIGTAIVCGIYVSTNLAYHTLLSVGQIQGSRTVAADAAQRALGPAGAGAVAAAVMVSTFGAVNGVLLSGPRIFYAMARDQLFFRPMGILHLRYRTPHAAILVQAGWATLLITAAALLRTKEPLYDQLITYVIFASWLFYGMSTAALFVLRRRQPDAERPYRAWGYPVLPAFFLLVALGFLLNTLLTKPVESIVGLGMVALGLPAFRAWERARDARVSAP